MLGEPYILPFKPGDKVIELGGGAVPMFRPNVDVRPGPATDLVWDFNTPSTMKDAQFQGIYCQYAIEHISWRNVRAFIAECHRLLAPGGIAVFIMPNTYEQAKKAAASDDWGDDIPSMFFGDLDYPENSHRAGWSPKSAERMFREQGFWDVKTQSHPATITDMILEARKSAAVIVRG